MISIRSGDLARNHGILIECVNRAETMIAVGDYQLAVSLVPEQQEWRQLFVANDFCAIAFRQCSQALCMNPAAR
jgi:hypothetical protein